MTFLQRRINFKCPYVSFSYVSCSFFNAVNPPSIHTIINSVDFHHIIWSSVWIDSQCFRWSCRNNSIGSWDIDFVGCTPSPLWINYCLVDDISIHHLIEILPFQKQIQTFAYLKPGRNMTISLSLTLLPSAGIG